MENKNNGCNCCAERARLIALVANAVGLFRRIEWNGRNGASLDAVLHDIGAVSSLLIRESVAAPDQTLGCLQVKGSG